jgi:hypothetical protein
MQGENVMRIWSRVQLCCDFVCGISEGEWWCWESGKVDVGVGGEGRGRVSNGEYIAAYKMTPVWSRTQQL